MDAPFLRHVPYFASRMGEILAAGVKIIGGCCGTTPEHIRLTAEILHETEVQPVEPAKPEIPIPHNVTNRLIRKLRKGNQSLQWLAAQ